MAQSLLSKRMRKYKGGRWRIPREHDLQSFLPKLAHTQKGVSKTFSHNGFQCLLTFLGTETENGAAPEEQAVWGGQSRAEFHLDEPGVMLVLLRGLWSTVFGTLASLDGSRYT